MSLDAVVVVCENPVVGEPYPIPKVRTAIWRGCRKRCPQCGEGALYKRWLELHEHCSVCGLRFVENQGDLWGVLLFVDRLVFIIPVITLIFFRLWNPNLTFFLVLGGGLVFALVYTMPHRNGMTIAIDYLFRRKNYLSEENSPEQP